MGHFLTSKENIVIDIAFGWLGESRINRTREDYMAIASRVPNLTALHAIVNDTLDRPDWFLISINQFAYTGGVDMEEGSTLRLYYMDQSFDTLASLNAGVFSPTNFPPANGWTITPLSASYEAHCVGPRRDVDDEDEDDE